MGRVPPSSKKGGREAFDRLFDRAKLPTSPNFSVLCSPNSKVFHPGLKAMGLAKSPRQRISLLGNGYKMHVVGHETPGQDFHFKPHRLYPQIIQIREAFFISLKDDHRSNAALGNMVGIFRNDEPRYPSHAKETRLFGPAGQD